MRIVHLRIALPSLLSQVEPARRSRIPSFARFFRQRTNLLRPSAQDGWSRARALLYYQGKYRRRPVPSFSPESATLVTFRDRRPWIKVWFVHDSGGSPSEDEAEKK
jgi:hypothetical protein